ncbi:probable G-protein coupled receptor Mth-like 3 isoform X3 [Amyelois transitella]|uniref:probable G-protein coupled receptor Mth-like 3 isoform X3 n=1 Tax=Amyelois transitella TaxID=680683 RepID=UPI00067C9D7A|nr:probable G-protein coupled receptor Mth-like 3 isoform X3 [Amyelois transitella]
MQATVTLVLALISRTLATGVKVCDNNSSIDISQGIKGVDGSITYDGVTYHKSEYYYDENTNVERGCICSKKICVQKCCPDGYSYFKKTSKGICVNDSAVFDPPIWDHFRVVEDAHAGDLFHIVAGKPSCQDPEVRVRVGQVFKHVHMTVDGRLYIDLPNKNPPWELHGPDKYCVDTFILEQNGVRTSKLDALVCFGENQGEHHFALNITCMLTSCVFILATCAVYAWLPELRNLHGRVLMAYLLSLFVAFLFMATMQILISLDKTNRSLCSSLTIVIYFAFEAAFFWLNVMCFDIWWTFSGKRGLSLERLSTRARFYAYAAYAFGVPTALTTLLAALEFSGLPPHPWLPLLRHQGCFLYGNARMIYLYGPVVILCIINLIFFVLTAIKIVQIKKQTAVLKSKESSTHDTQRNDKQRLLLYIKLFIVMGINWILEVISAIYPELENFWKITDAYNVLIGVTIFLIFVCKRKIFRLIKKRYKQVKGEPMSRTQTTVSSRTMSTKEDFQMGSIKIHNK